MKRDTRADFDDFSDQLAILKIELKKYAETGGVWLFRDFQRTFEECTIVLKNTLNQFGFTDTALRVQIDSQYVPWEFQAPDLSEIYQILVRASAPGSELIPHEELREWETMLRFYSSDIRSFQDAPAAKIIQTIEEYIPLLENIQEKASAFFSDPEELRASVGREEVYYLKKMYVQDDQIWKTGRQLVEGEKILETFRGVDTKRDLQTRIEVSAIYGTDLFPQLFRFYQQRGRVIFTNRRIIIVRNPLKREDKGRRYYSYPIGKVNYFEVKTARFWTLDRGLYLELAAGPKLRFYFRSRWHIHFRKIVALISRGLK